MAITRLRFTEQTSARIVGTIRDRNDEVVSSDDLTAATLTLWDVDTFQRISPPEGIINNRDNQDFFFNDTATTENGVTLYSTLQTDPDGTTYNFEWLLDPEDNPIITERRQVERHRATFHFEWASGSMDFELEIDVDNLRTVTS